MASRRHPEPVRLALSLGLRVERGKKHWKVFKGERLVAVCPHDGKLSRRGQHQWSNFRAAVMRAAGEEA